MESSEIQSLQDMYQQLMRKLDSMPPESPDRRDTLISAAACQYQLSQLTQGEARRRHEEAQANLAAMVKRIQTPAAKPSEKPVPVQKGAPVKAA